MSGRWFFCFWKGGDPIHGLHTRNEYAVILHVETHILGARSADDQRYRFGVRLYPEDPGQGYGLSGVPGQIEVPGMRV